MVLKKVRNSLYFGFVLLLGLITTGCETAPSDFYVKLSDLNFGTDDYVYVEVVSNNQGTFPVREAECYWTFDGSEPSENQNENTNYDWSLGYQSEFTMKIPKDFYSGTIKFLCKITYSAMGKKNTVVKNIDKQVSYKYHSALGQSSNLDLYKNKGYQEENSITKVAVHTTDSNTFVLKEDGDLKIKFLLGDTEYSRNLMPSDGRNVNQTWDFEDDNLVYIYKNMKAGDKIKINYSTDKYISEGSTGSIKSGEYLIILE